MQKNKLFTKFSIYCESLQTETKNKPTKLEEDDHIIGDLYVSDFIGKK